MATVAVRAYATLLKIGDGGGSEVFTTIAEVKSISKSQTLETVDVTAHDGSGWREHVATVLDGGEVSFTLNFNAQTTQGFTGGAYDTHVDRTLRNFQLVLPTTVSKTGSFAGYITSFNITSEVDGVLEVDATIQVSGAITWA